jgi:glucosamine--fructose-6-phosphate aminotransferase (isomerizing)
MCGIVGAILERGQVLGGMIEGLRVLEYRGYDSSGVALATAGGLRLAKRAGRLEVLEADLEAAGIGDSTAGIGHTRWATHGPPTDANAHPHRDGSGELAVVHNGIIENYLELRQELLEAGHVFLSDTDTEVLAHLIGVELEAGGSLAEAVSRSLLRVRGYYALAVLRAGDEPELVCARQGPPLCVGLARDGTWIGSDILALIPHTRDIVFLQDGDVAELSSGGAVVRRLDGSLVERASQRVDWGAADAGRGIYPHYMLKEIHEQPDVLARTAFHRIDEEHGDVRLDEPGWSDADLAGLERVQVIACGTALHAGHVARYLIEGLARVPVDVDFASEFRYRDPVVGAGTLALAISQSGETADTLAALRLARDLGARAACICNVAGSTMVRESDASLMTQAGPEIGVASTKAFVAQVVAAYLLAVRIGRAKGALSVERGRELLSELRLLRPKLEALLSSEQVAHVAEIADRHKGIKGFLFLGRGVNYPIALEGALKLKEISYMHAEGYAAGEMKHGPIAMIEPWMSSVVITGHGPMAEKVRSNIEQIIARGGPVIAVGCDQASLDLAHESIRVPECSEWLSPILNVVPLQLLSYEIARLRGCDIDKPRNLAKSVTVE